MKIKIVQQDISWGQPSDNISRLDSILDANQGADVYVLPEMFTTGFATMEEATVEKAPTPTLDWMKKRAAQGNCAIAGSVALEENGKCYNRFYFVKPDGSVTQYDKRHLFTYGGEDKRYTAGEERVVVEYKGVRFLLAVCYDLRFPVWLRNRGDYDAMIIVANWPDVRAFAWNTLVRARAIENQCYVLAANRVGTDPVCNYCGGTAFLDPYGATIAQAEDNKECVIEGDLDMSMLEAYREKFPVRADADDFQL